MTRDEMTIDDDLTVPHPDELFIHGGWRATDGGELHEVISPATEQPVAEIMMPSVADAEAAVGAAVDGFAGPWPRTSVAERVEVVGRFCAAMEERLAQIGEVWAVESGTPVRWSRTLHRFAAVPAWRSALDAAEAALAAEVRESPVGEVRLQHEPVGPVVAIMPYNGPLSTIATKAVPALLAGAPVIVKAAPESAMMMRIVAECAIAAGFPPGVISILPADVAVSQALVEDPRVEMISFTGGPRAAADILRRTADRLPRTVFELGGKSPALLLDDTDLPKAMRSLVAGAMSGSGQVCAALSRVLVPAAREEEVAGALAEAYAALAIGPPRSPDTDHGPLANRAARERTEHFVDEARDAGAVVRTGGARPGGFDTGFYYEPTLLTGVAENDAVAQQEVFGPVTVVLPYDDVDDAVRIANGTVYGLAASVYSADRDRAAEVAGRIRAGSVAINTFGPTVAAPYGGVKGSGWGREGGPEGIREFSDLKQVLLG